MTRKTIIVTLFFLAIFSCFTHFAVAAPKNLTILRVTPTGDDVPASKQIVLEFNRPVVPIGRMDRNADELGITISPALNCQWRWLNTSSLSCNLDDKDVMAQSTEYQLTIEPKISAEDGAKIDTTKTYKFITERPDITNYSFSAWRGASSPVIRVTLNQAVSKSSIEQHLYMTSGNSKERLNLIVKPDESITVFPHYILSSANKTWIKIDPVTRKTDDQKTNIKGEEARRVWLVEPTSPLELNAPASLRLEPGLVSAQGGNKSIKDKDVVKFQTFPDFKFVGVKCLTNQDQELLVKYGEPQDPTKLCNPLRGVSLAFSAPVLRSKIKNFAEFTPDLANGRKDINPWGEENRDYSSLGYPHEKDKLYLVALPSGLKAAQTYTVSLPDSELALTTKIKNAWNKVKPDFLSDEFNRPLSMPVSMTFSTDHRIPNFEMPYQNGVLEKGINSDIPLYVNNLDSYDFSYRMLTTTGVSENKIFAQKTSNVKDVQYAVPLGIRKMLDGQSGAIFGHLGTTPSVPNKWEGASRLFAQVTPFQAHLKLGHFNSIVWVTDLTTGLPVAGAKVSLFKEAYTTLKPPKDIVATATTDANGIATLPGTEKISPDQNILAQWKDSDIRLFVQVEKDKDMALLPIDNNFMLSTWELTDDNTWANNQYRYGHMKSWGMTAQGIYRTGDTMQYKIFLRNQNNQTLVLPPKGKYTLSISDPTGKVVEEIKDVTFSAFGAYSGEYKVPESAAVGWYNFRLKGDYSTGKKASEPKNEDEEQSDSENQEDGANPTGYGFTLSPLSVLVADFTPAPFKVTTELNGKTFHVGDKMNISSQAALHSGGPYSDAAAQATVTLRNRIFTPDTPVTKGFTFGAAGQSSEQLFQNTGILDDKGEWLSPYEIPQQAIYYGSLEVESAVQDERGKSVAGTASATFFGVDRFVGLKSEQWFYESKKPLTLKTLVVDEKGTPVTDGKIEVNIEFESINVAKVKGAGNAYISDVTREWKNVATCSNLSKAEEGNCTFTPAAAGSYRATATTTDTKGREHKTEISLWVSGADYVQWTDDEKLSLPVVPEKKGYKIGDTAKFMVKNPYPGATALITVERYGILDQFVQKLDGSTPVIEIPVKPDYMPGFYLSVLVVSPRVDTPPPELGQVDMGKPAFRMGYVTVPVSDPYKEITVDVKPAADVYRPRDKVKVNLVATPLNPTNEPIEIAVAVLDESVFDLITGGRKSFDPYQGFYSLDGLDMRNYSLLYRLLGRQKFELKGANPGGDGGGDIDMRTLFKYVSYWNPSLKTDAKGNAQIEFEAPDNLTGWRVLAIATTPTDRMGLGDGNFKGNRSTEIRPVMPNQVREGDKFSAGFSVMNRTDKPRTLTVSIQAVGDIASNKDFNQTKTEQVTLQPYKRKTIYIPLEANLLPMDRDENDGKIVFVASAGDDIDKDGMEFTVPILKKRVIDVAANYATTTEKSATETIAFPKDIFTDTGDVSVALSPSVISNISGAFRYMRDYPYLCWEQVLTKGVMAAHYKELKPWLPDTVKWPEAEDLTQKTLNNATNYQAPNGGMTYFVARDEYVDPYLSAYTALAFQWMKKDGYKIPEDVNNRLQDYLLNFLKQDAAPDFYQDGMKSTVRAVALSALAKSGKIDASDIARYRPHLKEMSLFGKANFMDAALSFPTTKDAAREAVDMIFAAGNETGGKFMFSESLDDGYTRLLATPLRDNCAILSAMLTYQKSSEDRDYIGDKPFKLVRMITQSRGSRDYWENTQENMFCMNGLIDYARVYETQKPDMTVTAKLDDKPFGETSFADFIDTPVTLSKPIQTADEGQTRKLQIDKDGDGRLYYATRLRYAMKDPSGKTNAGMDIHREYSVRRNAGWQLLKKGEVVKRGETIRVDLYLSLPAPRNFVVVNDPLPGGLETVNRDLATASAVDDAEAQYDSAAGSFWFKFNDWVEFNTAFWSFYHKELRADSARFFADWLPAGNYHLSYMTQVIADGQFAAPPTKAEEMYDPDVYGRGDNESLTVKTE